MRPTLPLSLIVALALTTALGCASKEPKAAPVGEPAAAAEPGGHPALNKLDETKKKMGEIDEKRREEQRMAEGEAAGQNP